MSRFVICNGMYRSGSTLAYNIARELLQTAHGGIEKVEGTTRNIREAYGRFVLTRPKHPILIKIHFYVPRGRYVGAMREAKFIFTYRNPLDIVASIQKRHDCQADSFMFVPQDWTRYEDDYFDQLNFDPSLMIKYEEMIADTPRTVHTIAEFLGLRASPAEAQELARRYSVSTVKAYADGGDVNIKEELKLCDRHISSDLGKPGTWREYLSRNAVKGCVDQCGRMMAHAGYEIPDS